MRSSVHDELQLEISAEDANAAPVHQRALRQSLGSRHPNEREDVSTFEIILALAEALSVSPNSQLGRHPSGSIAMNRQGNIFDARALLASDSPMLIAAVKLGQTTAVRDLLHQIADQNSGKSTAQLFELVESESAGENQANTGTDIPIEFRKFRRHIAVSTDGPTRTVSDEGKAYRLRPAAKPSASEPVAVDPPGRRSSEGFSSELALLDQSTTSLAERVQPQRIGTGSGVDLGDSPHSELRVVARNDNPKSPGFNNLPDPELRLITLNAETTEAKPSEDLITRLSGSWENSFFSSDEDTSENLPRSQRTRHIEPVPFDSANFRQHRRTGRSPSVRNDGIRIIHAANSRDISRSALISQQREDATDSGEDQAKGGNRVESTTFSNRTGQANSRPSPLFEDYLQDETSAASPLVGEPTLGAREAALEIASELQHLQSTGGIELLFRLRLQPEHLGAADIEIERIDDAWSVSVATTNDEATRALATEISRLQHHFQEINLTANAISVVTRSPTKYSRVW
jgi:Flagellar hook-length control protein FliK